MFGAVVHEIGYLGPMFGGVGLGKGVKGLPNFDPDSCK